MESLGKSKPTCPSKQASTWGRGQPTDQALQDHELRLPCRQRRHTLPQPLPHQALQRINLHYYWVLYYTQYACVGCAATTAPAPSSAAAAAAHPIRLSSGQGLRGVRQLCAPPMHPASHPVHPPATPVPVCPWLCPTCPIIPHASPTLQSCPHFPARTSRQPHPLVVPSACPHSTTYARTGLMPAPLTCAFSTRSLMMSSTSRPMYPSSVYFVASTCGFVFAHEGRAGLGGGWREAGQRAWREHAGAQKGMAPLKRLAKCALRSKLKNRGCLTCFHVHLQKRCLACQQHILSSSYKNANKARIMPVP